MGNKGLKRYTNGIENKMFIPGTEPDGFYLGVSEDYKRKNSESHKGKIAWNKGLTKQSDQRVLNYSHPISEKGRRNISIGVKNAWKNQEYRNNHLLSMNTAEYKIAVCSGKFGYKYNDLYFHSLPELIFYIYCIDNDLDISRNVDPIEYCVNNKIHHYIPDFKVDNQYIEIKGDWLLDENDNLVSPFKSENNEDNIIKNSMKSECMKNNNVKIIRTSEMNLYEDYINEKYGKDYLQQFKITN